MVKHVADFELPNVAAGPDPFRLSDAASREELDAVVLLFQRDYHCVNCRKQVQSVADRYDEFEDANSEVVSVLPEPVDQARKWQEQYGLPYPLLSDAEKSVSDEYDQPTRFGVLGSLHDMLGRMPFAMILDVRANEPQVAYTYEGKMPADRPSIDDLLNEIGHLVASDSSIAN